MDEKKLENENKVFKRNKKAIVPRQGRRGRDAKDCIWIEADLEWVDGNIKEMNESIKTVIDAALKQSQGRKE